MSEMNLRKNLKKKLRSREYVFAAWTSLFHSSITEIFAKSGVDFVGIDIEHGTISLEQSMHIIMAAQGQGVACLPRVASHDRTAIKRLLDAGADGIIVPMVSTPLEVEDLISASKYHPVGNRSYGIARGQGYGFDFDEYASSWNESSSLIIQIESTEGVENIDKMLAYDEVDGAMLGPYDLSGSLGVPGQLGHADVKAAEKKIVEACAKHGKACGTHLVEPDADSVKRALSAGYTFVVLSSDIFLLWKWSENINSLIKQVQ